MNKPWLGHEDVERPAEEERIESPAAVDNIVHGTVNGDVGVRTSRNQLEVLVNPNVLGQMCFAASRWACDP